MVCILNNWKKRILLTLFFLFICYLGMNTPIPGAKELITDNSSAAFPTIFQSNFNWFKLGVTPCLAAGIVISLLSMGLSPIFTKWKREKSVGSNKLKMFQYIFTAGFSYLIAIIFIQNAEGDGSMLFLYSPKIIAGMLTLGSLAILYLSEQITLNGIGNGLSLLILFTIGKSIVEDILLTLNKVAKITSIQIHLVSVIFILLLFIMVGIVIMYKYDKMRKIIIVEDENDVLGNGESNISISWNSAGITPIYLANVILMFITKIFSEGNHDNPILINICFYIIFAIMMYLFTYLNIAPKKKSIKMRLEGLIIPNVNPGKETEKYLKKQVLLCAIRSMLFFIGCTIVIAVLKEYTIIKHLSLDAVSLLLIGSILHRLIDTIKLIINDKKGIKFLY